jgi:hypothetical protein
VTGVSMEVPYENATRQHTHSPTRDSGEGGFTQRKDDMSQIDDSVPLDDVVLPQRVRRALQLANCETVGDARRISDNDLYRIRGCGRTSIRMLREAIGTNKTRSSADEALRDHFAGLAMQGMLVGCVGTIGPQQEMSAYAKGHCNNAIVDRAYAMADAMLKARNQ